MLRSKLNTESFAIRTIREIGIILIDLLIISTCFILSVILSQVYTLDMNIDANTLSGAFMSLVILVPLEIITFFLLRTFKVVWRYARGRDFLRLILANTLAITVFVILDQFVFHLVAKPDIVLPGNIPYKVYPAYILLFSSSNFVLVISRIIYAGAFNFAKYKNSPHPRRRTLIIGAGQTASTLIEELKRPESIYNPICMVDDDIDKKGRIIDDVPVVGKLDEIISAIKKYDINTIIFAIPSMEPEKRKDVLKLCATTSCKIKVLPFFSEMVDTVGMFQQMRDINIDDLLGREGISFDNKDVKELVENKVIMVTGGGGSIGSELCRQVMKYNPKRLIILDVYENSTYTIQQELIRNYGRDAEIYCEILSITDKDKVKEIYEEYRPQIVIHAAAHKHVPLMETNPEEAVKNNIYGTLNIAEYAAEYNVERFVMISTDKAVNPTNVMGATKRCCEKIIQMMSQRETNTKFAAVRFGNVLGSNGSVIPLFQAQVKAGGPVTVTDKDMIRYFMTIPEAVSLVLQAASFAKGGEIFVLNMGDPVHILTLAENVISMMGHIPYVDIKIEFTGLRPGEKLYEELLMAEEGLRETANSKIKIGKLQIIDEKEFLAELDKMRKICLTNDKEKVVEQLKVLVPTFKHDKKFFDKMKERTAQLKEEER